MPCSAVSRRRPLRQMQIRSPFGAAEAVSIRLRRLRPGPCFGEVRAVCRYSATFFFAGSPKRAHPPQIAMTKDLKDDCYGSRLSARAQSSSPHLSSCEGAAARTDALPRIEVCDDKLPRAVGYFEISSGGGAVLSFAANAASPKAKS